MSQNSIQVVISSACLPVYPSGGRQKVGTCLPQTGIQTYFGEYHSTDKIYSPDIQDTKIGQQQRCRQTKSFKSHREEKHRKHHAKNNCEYYPESVKLFIS